MRRKRMAILSGAGILLLLVMVGYLLMAGYYKNSFGPNTWINGVYCTGKTVEEVNSELLSQMKAPILVVTDKYGNSYELATEDADYTEDYSGLLASYQMTQNPFRWLWNVASRKLHTPEPVISYNSDKLRELWLGIPFVQAEMSKAKELKIGYEADEGYVLEDGIHNRLDTDAAYCLFTEALQSGQESVTFDETVYQSLSMTDEQNDVWQLWQKIDTFQNTKLYFDMGQEYEKVTKADFAKFLLTEGQEPKLTGEGDLQLDTQAIVDYVEALALEYDTYGKERSFQSTRGDVITMSAGIYGTKLKQSAERQFLLEYLQTVIAGETAESVLYHKPTYEKTAAVLGKDDIGDTYIEVDMTEQMLYYYVDGEPEIETPIVTGNMRRGWDTPEGFNYIYAKQKNRILRGANYATFVNYWMPVNGNIGLHDATWRSKFGEDVYETDGSHGCINMPLDEAAKLYEMAEVGTPVVMFY